MKIWSWSPGICVPPKRRCTKYTKKSQTLVFHLCTWLNKSARRTRNSRMKVFFPSLRIREQICLCLPHQGLYNWVSEALIITLWKMGMWWRDRKKYPEKLQVSCVVLGSKTNSFFFMSGVYGICFWIFISKCLLYQSCNYEKAGAWLWTLRNTGPI